MVETNLRKRDTFSEWTITADNVERRVARAIRICVGKHLQEMYGDLLNEAIPPKLGGLLRRLDRKTAVGPSPRVEHYLAEAEFCAELAESIKRPDYKDRWLKITQEWRDLADQAAGGKVPQHRH